MDSSREDHRHGGITLPPITAMTQGIPEKESSNNEVIRDSGNWSMQSQSKHSSVVSTGPGLHLQTILNSEDASNRYSSASGTPPSARYSNGQAHVLPALNQPYDSQRPPIDPNSTSFLDSRRSSIDSRTNLNQQVANTSNPHAHSPYENSSNPSHQSLPSSLQTRVSSPPASRIALSPLNRRPLTRGGVPPRQAPIISNPRSGGMPDPMASTPTKGFAWAFPDQPEREEPQPSSSPDSSLHGSSINTDTFNMRSLQEGTHHHSMQPKSVSDLRNADPQMGSGNYSRTPELRVSHKLAERKRRSEMKDLFEHLNRALPNPPGNKSSKWEILSKSIDYIISLKAAYERKDVEIKQLREDLQHARAAADENHMYQNEITAMYQQLLRVDPKGHHVFGPKTQTLVSQEGQQQQQQQQQQPQQPPPPPPTRLPPMQQSGQPSGGAGAGQWMPSSAMQGVEYGNGYERR